MKKKEIKIRIKPKLFGIYNEILLSISQPLFHRRTVN